jgi:hypothetical protein
LEGEGTERSEDRGDRTGRFLQPNPIVLESLCPRDQEREPTDLGLAGHLAPALLAVLGRCALEQLHLVAEGAARGDLVRDAYVRRKCEKHRPVVGPWNDTRRSRGGVEAGDEVRELLCAHGSGHVDGRFAGHWFWDGYGDGRINRRSLRCDLGRGLNDGLGWRRRRLRGRVRLRGTPAGHTRHAPLPQRRDPDLLGKLDPLPL